MRTRNPTTYTRKDDPDELNTPQIQITYDLILMQWRSYHIKITFAKHNLKCRKFENQKYVRLGPDKT